MGRGDGKGRGGTGEEREEEWGEERGERGRRRAEALARGNSLGRARHAAIHHLGDYFRFSLFLIFYSSCLCLSLTR